MEYIKTNYKKIIILILALLAFVSVLQGVKNAAMYSQDFQWDAAKVLLLHMNPYDESLNPSDELLRLGYEEVYKQMEANQFPSLLLLLSPYTILPPLTARYAWIVSNIIFTALMIYMLRLTFLKDIEKENFIILSLLMVAGTPWRNQIGVGQHTIYSLLFFLIAVYLAENDNKRFNVLLSGLLLAVSYFKYTLTAPLALYFIYKRKYKELLISVIPHIILTVFSAVWLNDSFINMIKKPLEVASALTGEGGMDIGSVAGASKASMLIAMVIMLLLLVMCIVTEEGKDYQLISILLLWSLIMIYHRSYDYFVMILPFCTMLDRDRADKKGWLIYYILLVLAVFFGLRLFHESDASLQVCAVFYYIFTLAQTVLIFKRGKNNVK